MYLQDPVHPRQVLWYFDEVGKEEEEEWQRDTEGVADTRQDTEQDLYFPDHLFDLPAPTPHSSGMSAHTSLLYVSSYCYICVHMELGAGNAHSPELAPPASGEAAAVRSVMRSAALPTISACLL